MTFPEETKRYEDALDEAAFHRNRCRELISIIDKAFKDACTSCGKWKLGECPFDCPVQAIRDLIPKEYLDANIK